MPVKSARTNGSCFRPAYAGLGCSLAALLIFLGSDSVQHATADGETRTISFHHIHTKEDLTVTYKRHGRYDEEGLKKINHLMRDWRDDEPIKMNPHLIDLLWEVNREVGGAEPIRIICGYRSSGTNASLRRRSSGVAKFSQHTRGNAIDFSIPGVPLEQVRAAGLRAQRGGVGFYPSSGFVHMDTGGVRHWPRMPEDQLAKVMSKGQLGSRFASDSRAGQNIAVAQAVRKPAFLSKLFGGGSDEEGHGESSATDKPAKVAAASDKPIAKPEKAADTAATKPAEKTAAVPVPQSRPARNDGFQLASATSMPAATGGAFQVAFAGPAAGTVFSKPATDERAANPRVAAATGESMPAPAMPSRPAQAASLVARANLSANDVINERGFWQGLPHAEPLEAAATGSTRPGAMPARAAAGPAIASADKKMTASIAPWPLSGRTETTPPANALAYAAQPAPMAQSRPVPPMGSLRPADGASDPQTTVAVKRSDDRPSVLLQPSSRGAQLARVGDRFNDPWMRAMIVSPSVHGFLQTTLYGVQDFRNLSGYLSKPGSSLLITFSDNQPHSSEKFAGSAVTFLSTVTFSKRTASLR